MGFLNTRGSAAQLRKNILLSMAGVTTSMFLIFGVMGGGSSAQSNLSAEAREVDRVAPSTLLTSARNNATIVAQAEPQPVIVDTPTQQPVSPITQETIEREMERIRTEEDFERQMMLEALRAPLGGSVQVRYEESRVGDRPLGDLERPVPPAVADVSDPTPDRRGLFQLEQGSILPITITRSFNTELSGTVHGMVRRDVLDSAGRGIVLLPAGSELIGTYGDGAALNQDRVLVLWNQLRLPDGSIAELDASTGTDLAGQAGIEGDRARGLWSTLGTTFALNLATGPGLRGLFGDGDSEIADAIREASQSTSASVADTYLRRAVDAAAVFEVRAGERVSVELARDLWLPPWRRG